MLDCVKIETLKNDLHSLSYLAHVASEEIEYDKSKNSLVCKSKATNKGIN